MTAIRGRDEATLKDAISAGRNAVSTEIKNSLKISDPNKAINLAWTKVDTDKDGVINWTEFGRFAKEIQKISVMDVTNKELRRVFTDIDTNRDGKVSRPEVEGFMRMRGWFADIRTAWKAADSDKDGFISWQEFGVFARALKAGGPLGTSELPRVFKTIDSDGDGVLGRTEVEAYLTDTLKVSHDRERLSEAWSAADMDGDGKINSNEFFHFANALKQFANIDLWAIEMRRVFNEIDSDGDGSLGEQEVYRYLARRGMCVVPSEMRAAWKVADSDGDSTINWEEFSTFAHAVHVGIDLSASELRQVFLEIDADFDEMLKDEEVWAYLDARGMLASKSQLEQIWKTADTDCDGTIGWEEFTVFAEVAKSTGLNLLESELRHAFREIDTDGDGSLLRNEVSRYLSERGISLFPEILDRCWMLADSDQDGVINWTEFGRFAAELKKYTTADLSNGQPRRVFMEIDTDKDGHINRTEVEGFMRMRGLYGDLRSAWNVADANQDGVISWHEFGVLTRELKKGAPLGTSELPRVFKAIDSDGDGVLGRTEVEAYLTDTLKVSHDRERLSEAWSAADMDGDGKINSNEFFHFANALKQFANIDLWAIEMRRVFNEIDSDGDGSLGEQEVYRYLARRGMCVVPSEMRAAWKVADSDGDSTINWEEFSTFAHAVHVGIDLSASELRQVFLEIDADFDEMLKDEEVWAYLDARGILASKPRLEQIWKTADTDCDGTIGWEEFAVFAEVAKSTGLNLLESELRQVFREIDTDGDGNLLRDEVEKYLAASGILIPTAFFTRCWELADTNKDGVINWTEFGRFTRDLQRNCRVDLSNGELRRVFSDIDTHRKGRVTRQEVEGFMRMRGLYADLRASWNAADCDKDGVISWQEFGLFARELKKGGPLGTSELPRVFKAIDTDSDGVLARNEVELYLTQQLKLAALAINPKHLSEAWESGDIDGDGKINGNEFFHFASALKEIAKVDLWSMELRRVFDEIDNDRDGRLGEHEVFRYLARRGMCVVPSEMRAAWKAADSDHDSRIDWKEFSIFANEVRVGLDLAASEVRRVFLEIDTDWDGALQESEVLSYLGSRGMAVSKSQLEQVWKAADTDGDGKINWEEFRVFAEVAKSTGIDLLESELRHVFREIDEDGDGNLHKEEVSRYMLDQRPVTYAVQVLPDKPTIKLPAVSTSDQTKVQEIVKYSPEKANLKLEGSIQPTSTCSLLCIIS